MNKQIDITNVVLTTDRLTLRPWRESDLNDFYEYASVDGVGQMAGWNPHRNVEESRMILGSFIKHKRRLPWSTRGRLLVPSVLKSTAKRTTRSLIHCWAVKSAMCCPSLTGARD